MQHYLDESRPRSTKNIYFYRSGDQHTPGVRIPVNTKKYRNLDALLDDLSGKVYLSYGVRRLFTSHGHDEVKNIQHLDHLGQYVCTDRLEVRKVQGIDFNKVKQSFEQKRAERLAGLSQFQSPNVSPRRILKQRTSSVQLPRPDVKERKKKARTKSQDNSPNETARDRQLTRRARTPTPAFIKDFVMQTDDLEDTDNDDDENNSYANDVGFVKKLVPYKARPQSAPATAKEKSKAQVRSNIELAPLDQSKLTDVQRRRLIAKEDRKERDASSPLPPKVPRKITPASDTTSSKAAQRKSINASDNQRKISKAEQAARVRAAIRIQAWFRGYLTRKRLKKNPKKKRTVKTKSVKQTKKPITTLTENYKQLSVAEKAEQIRAAIKIQSWYRGYKTRKELNQQSTKKTVKKATKKKKKESSNADKTLSEEKYSQEEELARMQAAVKLQALLRGYITRRRLKKAELIRQGWTPLSGEESDPNKSQNTITKQPKTKVVSQTTGTKLMVH